MQRSMDHEKPIPNIYIFTITPASMSSGRKIIKAVDYCCEMISPRIICLNKSRIMAISMDKLMWKGGIFFGLPLGKELHDYKERMTSE